MKQRLIAMVAIIVAWMALDYLFHGVILMADYEATKALWRPMEDMNSTLMNIVTILTSFVFVFIYCQLVKDKNMNKGIKLGVFVGVLTGLLAAQGYAYMPITTNIAVMWFLASLVKFTAAGAIVGKVVTCEAK